MRRNPLHSSLRRKPESHKGGFTETPHVYSITNVVITRKLAECGEQGLLSNVNEQIKIIVLCSTEKSNE